MTDKECSLDQFVKLRDVIDLLSRKDFDFLKGCNIFEKIKPFHGSCCCCQTCGRMHEECVCSHNELLSELLALETLKNNENMNIVLTNIWLEQSSQQTALRADFSNDRHYRSVIETPGRSDQVSIALQRLAIIVDQDPLLRLN